MATGILDPKFSSSAGLVGLGLAGFAWAMNYWGWNVPELGAYAVVTGSAVLLVVGLAGLLKWAHESLMSHSASIPSWRWSWWFKFKRDGAWPIQRFVPLEKALTRAYDKTKDFTVARIAERQAKNPREILQWYFYALWNRGSGVRLFGRRPPSTRLQEIPADEVGQLHLLEDMTLTNHGESNPRYIDLAIMRSGLRRRINEIKTWSK